MTAPGLGGFHFVREFQVVPDEQVEIAVAVEVEESASGPQLRRIARRRGGGGRHVAEGAVAVVVQQHVGAETADVDVRETVVVVVADGSTHDVAGIGHRTVRSVTSWNLNPPRLR